MTAARKYVRQASEKALVGAIYCVPSVLDGLRLDPEWLHDPWRRNLIKAMLKMHADGRLDPKKDIEADRALLLDALAKLGIAQEPAQTHIGHLLDCTGAPWTADLAPRYVDEVREAHELRQGEERRKRLAERIRAGLATPEELRAHADALQGDHPPSRGKLLVTTSAANVVAESMTWLWQHYIPLRMVTEFIGHADVGKSTLAFDIAARVTRGEPIFNGASSEPANVLIASMENHTARVLVPRLIAAGADMARVEIIDHVVTADGQERDLELPEDQDLFLSAIRDRSVRLLVVDPIAAYIGDGCDPNHERDVRRKIVRPLDKAIAEIDCSVVLVRHPRKGTGAAKHAGAGSFGFTAAARASYSVAKSAVHEGTKIMSRIKNNETPEENTPAVAFRIVGLEVPGAGSRGKLEWVGVSDETAEELIGEQAGEDRSELEHAVELIRDILADGEMLSTELWDRCRKEGVSGRTFQRAKKKLHLPRPRKRPGDGKHVTFLPATGEHGEHGEHEAFSDEKHDRQLDGHRVEGWRS